MPDRERHRSTDAQPAAGLGLEIAELAFHVLDFTEHRLGPLMVAGAGLGEVDLAGGPVEQAGPQVLLKLGNVFADQLGRQLQPLCGPGEAAFVHHGDEGAHGIDSVHGVSLGVCKSRLST